MYRALLLLSLALPLAGCPEEGQFPDETTPDDPEGTRDLTVTLLDTPEPTTDQAASWFEFSAPDAVSYRCTLDEEAPFECGPTAFVVPLDIGGHRFTVEAVGPDGETGGPVSYEWTIESVLHADHPEMIRTAQMPSPVDDGGWRGIFRINCDFAHSSYDDPIVFPGEPGRAHLHSFYGNMALDFDTTWESLYAQPQSSCQGNTVNASAYWIPALLAPKYTRHPDCDLDDPRDPDCRRADFVPERMLDGNGEPAWDIVPAVVGNDDVAHEVFYYSAGVDDLESIRNIPPGLRMIAGAATTTPDTDPQSAAIVRWHCQLWESSDAEGGPWSATIPECQEPDRLRMDIFFPSCWDGMNLDSADHKSHMAYPVTTGRGPTAVTACPESHPVPVIRPSYHYAFPVLPIHTDPETRSTRGWRIASDDYTVTDDQPGGLSLHGDWFNGWQPEVLQAVLDNCIRGELDCHDGNLANGLRLSGTQPGTQDTPPVLDAGRGGHRH